MRVRLYIVLVIPAQNARPILMQENLTELNNRQLLICSYLYTITLCSCNVGK